MMIWFPFLVAIASMLPQQVFLNDSTLCLYLEKVLAEAPNDFEGFKGTASDSKGPFVGTFKLTARSDCKLYPRHEAEGAMVPPEYSCTIGEPVHFFDEARNIYDLSKEGLRACLLGWVYEEGRRGGEMTGYASWYFRGYMPGVSGARVTLRLNDLAGRRAAAAGKTVQEISGPTVVVDISVTDSR